MGWVLLAEPSVDEVEEPLLLAELGVAVVVILLRRLLLLLVDFIAEPLEREEGVFEFVGVEEV